MAVTEWFSNLWLKTVKPSEDRGMKDVLEASENFRQQKRVLAYRKDVIEGFEQIRIGGDASRNPSYQLDQMVYGHKLTSRRDPKDLAAAEKKVAAGIKSGALGPLWPAST